MARMAATSRRQPRLAADLPRAASGSHALLRPGRAGRPLARGRLPEARRRGPGGGPGRGHRGAPRRPAPRGGQPLARPRVLDGPRVLAVGSLALPRQLEPHTADPLRRRRRPGLAGAGQLREGPARAVASGAARSRRGKARGESPERYRLAWVEIHKKLAIPLACLAFALVGIPLAETSRRGGRGSGFALSLAILVGYYVLLSSGETWAQNGTPARRARDVASEPAVCCGLGPGAPAAGSAAKAGSRGPGPAPSPHGPGAAAGRAAPRRPGSEASCASRPSSTATSWGASSRRSLGLVLLRCSRFPRSWTTPTRSTRSCATTRPAACVARLLPELPPLDRPPGRRRSSSSSRPCSPAEPSRATTRTPPAGRAVCRSIASACRSCSSAVARGRGVFWVGETAAAPRQPARGPLSEHPPRSPPERAYRRPIESATGTTTRRAGSGTGGRIADGAELLSPSVFELSPDFRLVLRRTAARQADWNGKAWHLPPGWARAFAGRPRCPTPPFWTGSVTAIRRGRSRRRSARPTQMRYRELERYARRLSRHGLPDRSRSRPRWPQKISRPAPDPADGAPRAAVRLPARPARGARGNRRRDSRSG